MRRSFAALLPFLILNTPTTLAQEFDYSVLHGEWGAYEGKLFKDDWYTYLEIGPDGGTFSYSYSAESALIFRFDESQMVWDNGLLLINLPLESKCPSRLVVSAFRSERGSALLTGSLYMFRCEGGSRVLFNTIPQRMSDLSVQTELSERIHSTMAARNDR